MFTSCYLCISQKKPSVTQLNHLFQKDLPDNVVPVFPAVSTVHFKDMAIRRSQIPLTSAFVLTEYM